MSELTLSLFCALVAEEHLIVRVAPAQLATAEESIKTIVSDSSLTCASIRYTSRTTIEDLPRAVLEDASQSDHDTRRVVNVIVALNLDQSTRDVQVQALEVLSRP